MSGNVWAHRSGELRAAVQMLLDVIDAEVGSPEDHWAVKHARTRLAETFEEWHARAVEQLAQEGVSP